MAFDDDLFSYLYKTTRGMRYDMTVPASQVGVLVEPSLSRVGFIISNPFAGVIQICTEAMSADDIGIVLPSFSGPHFFTLHNCYGVMRQRWHFRCVAVPAASMFTVIELLVSEPL